MSTHQFYASSKKIGLLLLAIPGFMLGLLLIVVQLLLPVAVLASPVARSADVGRDQTLDLVGVSVVRLLVDYGPASGLLGRLPASGGANHLPYRLEVASSAPSGGACTGLGIVVESWEPGPAGELNSFVLTDGDLVNEQPLCGGITSTAGVHLELATIQIFASATATGQPLATINCSGSSRCTIDGSPTLPPICPSQGGCAHNLALLPFATPYDLPAVSPSTTVDVSQSGVRGIELANSQGQFPPSPASAQVRNFLVPCANQQCGGDNPEAGMPLVNSAGQLVGLHLLNEATPRAISSNQIMSLLATANTLLKQPGGARGQTGPLWQNGVHYYYQHRYDKARQAFQQVLQRTRNQFKGAQEFLSLINSQLQATASEGASPGGGSQALSLAGLPLLVWFIGGVVVLLVIILLFIIQTMGRAAAQRRRELKQFHQDLEEAQRRSDLESEAPRARRGPPNDYPMASAPPAPPAAPAAPVPPAAMASPLAMAAPHPPVQAGPPEPGAADSSPQTAGTSYQCPQCHQPVSRETERCPRCGLLLSPSASGLRLRALPPEALPNPALSMSAPPPPASSLPLSDQPTLAIMPPLAASAAEKTQPVRNRQRLRSLQLVVGCRTDPGIKRRHKPNEDSLFAMLGRQRLQSQLQSYGFFVVADGMGGHANGQDASRLAIQTIVNYVLPQLTQNRDWTSDEYQRLLVDGVQSANQAVHEQNQRERADMGTTMTTALIIGSIAYVANVGDSRTYLYREGVGLRKVTQDHSVVASLVDAGIIKPEDIYTHPKRNQIYRSLGEKPMVEVDPFREELLPGDKLLLCSDGLWDMTRDPHIEEVLRKPAEPQKLVNDLVQLALDGGGEDNISVIVVQLVESGRQTTKGFQILAKPDQLVMPALPQT